MKRPSRPRPSKSLAAAASKKPSRLEQAVLAGGAAAEPERPEDRRRIVDRPDGYHWISADGRVEFGPFETLELALADMSASDERAAQDLPSTQELADEFGVAGWIDPETGELAEGPCPPHLDIE